MVPVRLCDIPPNIRFAAARRIARHDPSVAIDLILAATHPSNTTYYLPAHLKTLVDALTTPSDRSSDH